MTDGSLTQTEKVQRGAEDSGHFFHQMVDFVGFTPDDAAAIRESGLVIEKHLPTIVGDFYTHLLRYPPTRVFFLKPDGTLNLDYIQKRMHHLTNFWRRAAAGKFDDEFARYVDYVGLAHTRQGADPNIFIAERYVIGQVGFMQRAISRTISEELHEVDPELERRANRAWNLLMMVILELLSRVYETDSLHDLDPQRFTVDSKHVQDLAVETYERGLGLFQSLTFKEVSIGRMEEIPEGSRKIIEIDGLSIGVFHHQGEWIALRNHCLHAGGPVATGSLDGDTLVCPWHGFRYRLATGELIVDPALKLERYEVRIRNGEVIVMAPDTEATLGSGSAVPQATAKMAAQETRRGSEFSVDQVSPGHAIMVTVGGEAVAVFNVNGIFYATSNTCTHAGGPLNEGVIDEKIVVCPWHGSCFDVTNGAVLCDPATEPLKTYSVHFEGKTGRVSQG